MVAARQIRVYTEDVTLLNPAIIFEVLSKSTEAADRGFKFECYRTIESLQVYVLIDQYAYAIDVHTREQNGTWRETFLRGAEAVLELSACDVTLPLADLYESVDFAAASPPVQES